MEATWEQNWGLRENTLVKNVRLVQLWSKLKFWYRLTCSGSIISVRLWRCRLLIEEIVWHLHFMWHSGFHWKTHWDTMHATQMGKTGSGSSLYNWSYGGVFICRVQDTEIKNIGDERGTHGNDLGAAVRSIAKHTWECTRVQGGKYLDQQQNMAFLQIYGQCCSTRSAIWHVHGSVKDPQILCVCFLSLMYALLIIIHCRVHCVRLL